MPQKDLHSRVLPQTAISARNIAANTLITGSIIDTRDYKSLDFVLQSGTLTDGTYTPIVTVGDAANLADGAPASAADLIGTIANATFAATDDNVAKHIGYRGGKRYARLDLQPSGVTTGGLFSATALQGEPLIGPVP